MTAADTITRSELADLIEVHGGQLVAALRASALPPVSRPVAHDDAAPAGTGSIGGPVVPTESWIKVGELEGQTYSWPEGPEAYDPFEVFETTVDQRPVQIGFGNPNIRGNYYGSDRGYWVAFEMVNGSKRRPIVVFMEADDFEKTGDLVALIKGKGEGGRSMFEPGEELPAGYEHLDVEIFRDRITGPQAFNRQAVIARGGDRQAVCTHAFLQLGLRP